MRAAAVGLLGLAAACRHAPTTHGMPGAPSASAPDHFVRVPPAAPVAPLDSAKRLEPRPHGKVSVLPDNLAVLMGGFIRPSFSYGRWAEGVFEDDMRALERDEPGQRIACMREIKVRALAWIPPFLSLREETYQSCPGREAHPGGETRFTTLQINADRQKLAGPRPASLTDFFDAAVLARALRADPIVVKALGKDAPSDLAELVRALAETSPVVDAEHCYAFPDDLLTRFAFHERHGENLTVRVGLPGSGPCRYALTELGLSLPLPAVLEMEPRGASDDFRGFLAPEAPDATAVIRLHSP